MYYLIANFYKRFKSEADSWHSTSVIISGFLLSFFFGTIIIFLYGTGKIDTLKPWMIITPGVVFLSLSVIRYNKFTNYDEVRVRIKELDKTTYAILRILAIIFIAVSLFGLVGSAIYFGSSK